MELETREETQFSRGWKPSEYEMGKRRRVKEALQELKDDELIRSYLATGKLTFSIIYVKKIYKVCSISVKKTGDKHPKGAVIRVDLWEDLDSIKRRILKAIAAKERGWFLRTF